MSIVPQEADALRVRLAATCARVEHLLGRHERGPRAARDARSPSSATPAPPKASR